MDKSYQKLEIVSRGKELIDISKTGKKRDWNGKKEIATKIEESYLRCYKKTGNETYAKKSEKIHMCATYLMFLENMQTEEKKLFNANFCRQRLCPMCKWRLALKNCNQLTMVLNEVDKTEYGLIFVTFTIKNCIGEKLENALKEMRKGLSKMYRYKIIKKCVKGAFMGIEITHNLNPKSKDYDTYHPHIHCVWVVPKEYATKGSDLYITQAELTNLWKRACKLNYTPVVDIRKADMRSILEVAKYTTKDSDIIVPNDEEMTDKTLMILDSALKGKRLIEYSGMLKEIHKRLKLDDPEDGDLINIDGSEDDKILDNFVEVIYYYNFGYKAYYEDTRQKVSEDNKKRILGETKESNF